MLAGSESLIKIETLPRPETVKDKKTDFLQVISIGKILITYCEMIFKNEMIV